MVVPYLPNTNTTQPIKNEIEINYKITYRSETEERVWLVHTSDSYGATAAAAFGMAASSYSVALPITDEDGEVNATSSSDSTSGGQEALRASVEIVRT